MALNKLLFVDKKYHNNPDFLNMFFLCIEKTKQLDPNNFRKNSDARNLYYKIKISQGEDINYLDFARINKNKLRYISSKEEIKKDMVFGYTKVVEQLNKYPSFLIVVATTSGWVFKNTSPFVAPSGISIASTILHSSINLDRNVLYPLLALMTPTMLRSVTTFISAHNFLYSL